MTLDLPVNAGPEREAAILDHVRAGRHAITWGTVTSTTNDRTAVFDVFADALTIDNVRVNVSAETAQRIADLFGCALLTPKLADLLWAQRAVTLPPFPRPITSSTAAMIAHSEDIDRALAKAPYAGGIVSTVGKHWVLDNALATKKGRAMNYGWHFAGPAFQGLRGEVTASALRDANGALVRLIQGRGTAHDGRHVDYSQTCVLVARRCLLDGKDAWLDDILKDPTLAPLASHQGVMTVLRQPGVPESG
jgi:hypothetical protein